MIYLWIYLPLPDSWYDEVWPEPGDELRPPWDGTLPMIPDDRDKT